MKIILFLGIKVRPVRGSEDLAAVKLEIVVVPLCGVKLSGG
jgi:hypothetical protein